MNVKSCVVLGVHVRIIVIAKNVYCHKPGRIEIPEGVLHQSFAHERLKSSLAFRKRATRIAVR